jgi:hypothetical protein
MREIYNPVTGKIEYVQETVRGERGPAGPVGKTGSPGRDGVDGKNGIDGRDGIDGKNGIRGCKWFRGSGYPTKVEGSMSGDYYLDLDTGDVYELS